MATTITRGVRNNNPGNINRDTTKWNGMAIQQTDARFCVFVDPKYGIRALVKVLISYQEKHGLRTIDAMIGRWAPENENDTEAYKRAVGAQTNIARDVPIDIRDAPTAIKMANAIIAQENSGYAYPKATVALAVSMAYV
jgi:hypothetical protein